MASPVPASSLAASLNLQALLGHSLFAQLKQHGRERQLDHTDVAHGLAGLANTSHSLAAATCRISSATPTNQNPKRVSNGNAALESVAAAAVAVAEVEAGATNKLAKRRQQIALASRKSRAKRKRELEDLRDTNQQLQDEISRLRKRLRAFGDVDDHEGAAHDKAQAKAALAAHTPTSSKAEDTSSDSSSVDTESQGFLAKDPKRSVAESLVASATAPKLDMKNTFQFLESRLAWYFQQLKDDAARFHAGELSDESRRILACLEARIVCLPMEKPE